MVRVGSSERQAPSAPASTHVGARDQVRRPKRIETSTGNQPRAREGTLHAMQHDSPITLTARGIRTTRAGAISIGVNNFFAMKQATGDIILA